MKWALRTAVLFLLTLISAQAGTTIDAADKSAYGANIGWVNWRGNITNGAVIGQYFCTGYIYSANCGWICLGKGPTNSIDYSNDALDDFGVNVTPDGKLSGYAYGANIGWINFKTNGNPKIDLLTGNFSGSAYGSNIGWLGLSNAFAFVQTDSLDPGPDSDLDDIPDHWELKQVGNLTDLMGGADFDSDDVNDDDEYAADTNPDNDAEYLEITGQGIEGGSSTSVIIWASQPSRLYSIEGNDTPANESGWSDVGLGAQRPDAGSDTTRAFPDAPSAASRVYRVRAQVPLAP